MILAGSRPDRKKFRFNDSTSTRDKLMMMTMIKVGDNNSDALMMMKCDDYGDDDKDDADGDDSVLTRPRHCGIVALFQEIISPRGPKGAKKEKIHITKST